MTKQCARPFHCTLYFYHILKSKTFCNSSNKFFNTVYEKLNDVFIGLNIFISKSNIHGNYNIIIYINIIGSERKHYSLFDSSPNHVK